MININVTHNKWSNNRLKLLDHLSEYILVLHFI